MEERNERSGMMTRDEWMAWLEKSWAEAQALAYTPEQKPVAYVTGFHNGHCVIQPTDLAVVLPVGMALYRAPTAWVGLTDDEIAQLMYKCDVIVTGPTQFDFARAIEAKLKEKHT